jgi:UDP-N-acetylmuramoyl-tripeptide--D-alanyl-D-alanine ligase
MTILRGDIFFIVLIAFVSFFMSRPYVYVIQQDNYRLDCILKSRRLKFVYMLDIAGFVGFTCIWGLFYFFQARAFWGFLTVLFFYIFEFALYFMEDLPDKKKPLKYTKRAVRAFLSIVVFGAGGMVLLMAYTNVALEDEYLKYVVLMAFPPVFPLLFSFITASVNVFERLNNLRYERRTAKLLSRDGLIKIAVTGSYGKTSVKNILAEMLKSKYNVLATPASYNTPMGIAKTVKQLDASHDVFIAEMGARRVGDIKKLMKIVKPQYSVLTAVNKQHLETFKTEENIFKEKSLVVSMLTGDGFAVVNDKLRDRFQDYVEGKTNRLRQHMFAGFDVESYVFAKDMRVSGQGSLFTLVIDGEEYTAVTRLLGRHNIENIALAAALASALLVEPENIVRTIENLQPVPHRLELVEGSGIQVVDDSFNSNPDSARCSLEVLSMFEGRKIVMTPGLVELGRAETDENYNLGLEISEVADVAMLIGKKRVDTIRRGILDGGFIGEIYCYENIKAAEADFVNRLHLNDVLLILNDLPDIYED